MALKIQILNSYKIHVDPLWLLINAIMIQIYSVMFVENDRVKKNLRNFTDKLKSIYEECFASKVLDGNHYWLPQLVCSACKTMMDRWKKIRITKN